MENKLIRDYSKEVFGTFAKAMRMIGLGEAVSFSIEHMNGIRSEVSRQKILCSDKDWRTEIDKENKTIRVWRTR